MSTGVRRGKAKIKPPRKHGPDFSVSETWATLATAIREVHNHNASNLSFEETYRHAYKLVLHKQGELVYNGVNALVTENVERLAREVVQPAFPSGMGGNAMSQSHESERLLKAVKDVWDDHINCMSKLQQVLDYVNRVYVPSSGVPSIYDSGLNIFYRHMIKPPKIQDHIIAALLNQIRSDREGFAISRSAIKSCVDVFLHLQPGVDGLSVYKHVVEPAVLKESEVYYREEGQRILETHDAPEFISQETQFFFSVEEKFRSEDMRVHYYLSPQTAPSIKQILEDNLLTPHLATVLYMPKSGLENMIDTGNFDALSRLYRLFRSVPTGLTSLRKALKESVLRRGKTINEAIEVTEEEDSIDQEAAGKNKGKARLRPTQTLDIATSWVGNMLKLKDSMDQVWKLAFDSDREVETSLDEAFETSINLNQRSPEFISLFIDEHLKKGLKGKTDDEVDAVLDKTIVIFRYISEKDVFERYYKSHLAKRLLHGRSVSDDAERGMLSKLKVECGYQFTGKMEGMFTDMKLSSETMDAYRSYIAKTSAPEIEIVVIVMTSTMWPPVNSGATCNLPDAMLKACKSFENFYLSRHSGRRLTWQPGIGNADVKVTFDARSHDLNVSTLALVVLLLFEDMEADSKMSYEDIQNATGIPEAELKRTLQSLACAKYKILKKHPPSRDVASSDSFSFNHSFSAPLQRIKVSAISAKVESNEDRKETRDRIDEERRHQTEACIVRIMKSRKHMTHIDLVNEVAKQLSGRFMPNPLNIKKRIEGLIEREYLERCEDRKSYNYLA